MLCQFILLQDPKSKISFLKMLFMGFMASDKFYCCRKIINFVTLGGNVFLSFPIIWQKKPFTAAIMHQIWVLTVKGFWLNRSIISSVCIGYQLYKHKHDLATMPQRHVKARSFAQQQINENCSKIKLHQLTRAAKS